MAVNRPHPVIVGAGVVALAGADEGQVLDARDVIRMRAMQPAARMGVGIERQQGTVGFHLRGELVELAVAAVAPLDAVGPGQLRDFQHPLVECFQAATH